MHNVLLIEDDHSSRVWLREAMERFGWTVFSAADGAEGMATLKRISAPCIIFLDQNLPVMDGEAFLKAKSGDAAIRDIPVVVISSTFDKISHLGAAAFIKKPVSLDALSNALEKYCRQYHRK